MDTKLDDIFAQHFPVAHGPYKVFVVDTLAAEGDTATRLLVRLVVFEDGTIRDVIEQHCDADVTIETVSDLADQVAARLASLEAPFMPTDLFFPETPYEPVVPRDETGVWLSGVLEAIREQAHSHGFDRRLRVVEQWDVVPRTTYFLDLVATMAGGNGFEVFFAQHSGEVLRHALAALDEAGCDRLAKVFRQAIDLAQKHLYESTHYVDQSWVERERIEAPSTPAENAWKALDAGEPDGTWVLIEEELQPTLAEYIERHRGALVA